MLPFVGNGDQKKFTKNPRHLSMQNSQANSKKKSTKVFWRAGKVRFVFFSKTGQILDSWKSKESRKIRPGTAPNLFTLFSHVHLGHRLVINWPSLGRWRGKTIAKMTSGRQPTKMDAFRPCKPIPLKLGAGDSPPKFRRQSVRNPSFFVCFGHGEVRVYISTGVSRRVRRTSWESWELQIPCFEEFFWGGNTLGLLPASLPHF